MPDREYLSLMGGEMWVERTASPWIAVVDRLPPADRVVALNRDRDVFVAVRIAGQWHEGTTRRRLLDVTHWMPIPPLPERPQ